MTATRGLKKDSDRAITPAAEAVRVPALLAPPGSPQAKSCATFTLNSHWGRAATGSFRLGVQGHFSSIQLFATLWTVACQASLSERGVLQARILERIGQYWLPYPSRTLYFLLPWLPTPLSTWCCQNPCDPSSCTTSTPGPHRDKPKSSRAASEAHRSGRPTRCGGNKTTVETRGQYG